MIKKLMIGTVAGFLLIGASNVMALVDVWVFAGVQSTSGKVQLPYDLADPCMQAVGDLRSLGFEYKGSTQLEPRLIGMYFEKPDDAVTLFCALLVGQL